MYAKETISHQAAGELRAANLVRYTLVDKREEFHRRCADTTTQKLMGYRVIVAGCQWFVAKPWKCWVVYHLRSGAAITGLLYKTRKEAIEDTLQAIEKCGGMDECVKRADERLQQYGRAN